MRVIAGEYKGRKLESPAAEERVRPTSDKVKEAVFSMISNNIYGRVFADIFAGTGGIGIEALSRGAARCYFGDKSRESIALIKRNLQTCGIHSEGIVMPGSFERVIAKIEEKVDVFYLDPPFSKDQLLPCINKIVEEDKLAEDGMIICEHDKHDELPDEAAGLIKTKEKKYGRIKVTVYTNTIK